jgi:hypothetical protein
MKIICIGTGCCGFLRFNDLLVSSGVSVCYKLPNVKYQNSREVFKPKSDLIWEKDAMSVPTRVNKCLNNKYTCLIGHFYLPYIEELLSRTDVIVVCLKSIHTIKALFEHWGYCNPLTLYRNNTFRIAYEQYPDLSHLTYLEATKEFYSLYYDQCDKISHDRFRVVDADKLFTDLTYQKEIIQFMGLSIAVKSMPCADKYYYTTNISGGLGNAFFQMSETIAFAHEYGLPMPSFGIPSMTNKRPLVYQPDKFLGGHSVEEKAFVAHFNKIQWIGKFNPSYDDKFMINDMYTFNKVHHMRSTIIEAFSTNIHIAQNIDKLYGPYSNTVSVHYRSMTLAADTATSYNGIPLAKIRRTVGWYNKVLAKFPVGSKFLIFSDKLVDIKSMLSSLEDIYDMQFVDENTFSSLYIMSQCNGHVVDCSTYSFWGAYLDVKQPNVQTICNAYLKHVLTPNSIPYKEWEFIM